MVKHEVTFSSHSDLNTFIKTVNKTKEINEKGLIIRNASLLREQVDKLMNTISAKTLNGRTMFIYYVYFITNKNFDNFCTKFRKLNQEWSAISAVNKTNRTQPIWSFDEDEKRTNDYGKRLRIKINATRKEELDYAIYLCEMNENLVKPRLQELSNKFNQKLDLSLFNRLYSVKYINGKSVHDVSDILTIKTHIPKLKYKRDDDNTQVTEIGENKCPDCENGYIGHFRENLDPLMGLSSRDYFLNVTDIYFDSFFLNAINQIKAEEFF
jgi:hypothetical protein